MAKRYAMCVTILIDGINSPEEAEAIHTAYQATAESLRSDGLTVDCKGVAAEVPSVDPVTLDVGPVN